jgi:hypothetical protein
MDKAVIEQAVRERRCYVEGCDHKYYAKGMCDMHRQRKAISGDPLKVKFNRAIEGKPMQLINRAVADNNNECILWPYMSSGGGYGRVKYRGVKTPAHSLALRLKKGDPPVGKFMACHKCHTPGCINPNHLYWGDGYDNSRDKITDGTLVYGDRHPHAKITSAQAAAIRQDDRPYVVIAREFNVTSSTIGGIKRGKTWRHLNLDSGTGGQQ